MKKVVNLTLSEEDRKYYASIPEEDELLPLDEEVRLILQVQRGGEDAAAAKEKIMRCNQRFVRHIAKEYVSVFHPLDELIVEGNIGLEAAIYRSDMTRGFKFIAYAVWWIRQSILQTLSQPPHTLLLSLDSIMNGDPDKMSAALNKLSHRERDILQKFFGIGCQKLSPGEIASLHDIKLPRLLQLKDTALRRFFEHYYEQK